MPKYETYDLRPSGSSSRSRRESSRHRQEHGSERYAPGEYSQGQSRSRSYSRSNGVGGRLSRDSDAVRRGSSVYSGSRSDSNFSIPSQLSGGGRVPYNLLGGMVPISELPRRPSHASSTRTRDSYESERNIPHNLLGGFIPVNVQPTRTSQASSARSRESYESERNIPYNLLGGFIPIDSLARRSSRPDDQPRQSRQAPSHVSPSAHHSSRYRTAEEPPRAPSYTRPLENPYARMPRPSFEDVEYGQPRQRHRESSREESPRGTTYRRR
ncbi:hypothetical protein MBLNU230_g2813t1 [Neophaeotheca triangularis]